jgi:DnaJ-class molecular chaperone
MSLSSRIKCLNLLATTLSTMPLETHYTVLGISRSASTEETVTAYNAILLTNHPDKTHHLALSARDLAEWSIRADQAAYEVLLDPEKAAKYDAEIEATSRTQQELSPYQHRIFRPEEP